MFTLCFTKVCKVICSNCLRPQSLFVYNFATLLGGRMTLEQMGILANLLLFFYDSTYKGYHMMPVFVSISLNARTTGLASTSIFPGGSNGKVSTCNAGDLRLAPGLGRSPGGGHGNPLQYSCLENPMDRGTW